MPTHFEVEWIFKGTVLLFLMVAVSLVLWRLSRCVHQWELVDKTEFPSPMENFRAAGGTQLNHWMSDSEKLCSRTVVLALRCPKCGAAKIHKISQS